MTLIVSMVIFMGSFAYCSLTQLDIEERDLSVLPECSDRLYMQ